MATVTGLTAARMQEIEAASVVSGEVTDGDLILTKHDGTEVNAGSVIGPAGPMGPQGTSAMPGEIKLWPSTSLPDPAKYGTWAWANGDIFNDADHPDAAANIGTEWRTAMGAADPGVGKSRVPDLRGMVPACPDALPVAAGRANRMARAEAVQVGKQTGVEKYKMIATEMPVHSHGGATGVDTPDHYHSGSTGGESNDHSHSVPMNYNRVANMTQTGGGNAMTGLTGTAGGTVAFSSQTGGRSAGHTHGFSTGYASARHAHSITPNGADTPHENVQPTVMVPYIVFMGA